MESIKFTNHCQVPLKSGEYRISVTEETDIKNCKLSTETTNFIVTSERFTISPGEVYSVYPPKEAMGSYEYCLPHIILHRRTLPWERSLFEDDNGIPWVALLVFDYTEGIHTESLSCQQALQKKEGVYLPAITLGDYDDKEAPCTIIDIPTPLFKEVLPSKEDLKYLAHGRCVSLDDKVTDSEVKSEWFSCVVANRYSRIPINNDEKIPHTAYLVSLEGLADYIDCSDKETHPLSNSNQVRMFVLTSWNYTMSKKEFDFANLFLGLNPGVLKSNYEGADPQIQNLIDLGYYPLNHNFREGSKTVSWYQPPFIPYPMEKKKFKCHAYGDELLMYDPENSMFDVTYQAAWQVGRMLAMAAQPFAKELYKWKINNKQKVKKQIEHRLLIQNLLDKDGTNIEETLTSSLKAVFENVLKNDGIIADHTGILGTEVERIWKDDKE